MIVGQGSDNTQESLRSLFEIRGSGDTILEYVQMKNTHGEDTGTAQAEVIGHQSSGTLAAYNCSFLSGQDTIRTESKAWFYHCYIEGDVDFLWMESAKGVVALYEDCELKAIGSRTKTAYFTAPRLAVSSKVGKGLVIYNSKLIVDEALSAAYLGRNPWNEKYYDDFYEQVAVVGTTVEGTLTDTWYTKSGRRTPEAHGTSDQIGVGFKTDSTFSSYANGGKGAVLTGADIAAEYAGRNNILNRLYNVDEGYFQADSSVWDIAKVISSNGWTVTADNSKYKLSTDSTKTNVEYKFSDTGLLQGSDPTLTYSGFGQNKDYALGNSGATLTFWIVGDCTITVGGYYSGAATVSYGSKSASYSIATQGSTENAILTLSGISSSGVKVTVQATQSNTYITSINVQYTSDVDSAWAALKAKLAANTTYNFTTLEASSTPSSVTASSGTGGAAMLTNFVVHSNAQYGVKSTAANATITVPVSGNCTIKVYVSYANTGGTLTCTNATTSDSYTNADNKNTPAATTFAYTGGSGTATVSTPAGNVYIASISVIYVE